MASGRFFDVVKRALTPGGTLALVDTSAGEARYEEAVEGLPAPAVRRRLWRRRRIRKQQWQYVGSTLCRA